MLKEVAEGIFQVRLPLPFRLNHVQCYLLRDGDGWTIVDTGLHTVEGEATWLAVFEQLAIAPYHIRGIILTHTHPDHYGMAGWLQQWATIDSNAPTVFMSAREAELAQMVWVDFDQHIEPTVRFYKCCGLPHEMARELVVETGRTRRRTLPAPTKVGMLTGGEALQIGSRTFTLIAAPGHSEGQLLLYDTADRLLLCGDHTLMTITPHIGYWYGIKANPLPRFLNSLHQLIDLDVRLALPGHRALISDWRGRLTELIDHHHDRLQHTLNAVTGNNTIAEVAQRVFRLRELNIHEARFAVAETRSHLEMLVEQGKVVRDDGACWRYSRRDA